MCLLCLSYGIVMYCTMIDNHMIRCVYVGGVCSTFKQTICIEPMSIVLLMTYPSLITASDVLSISNRCEPFPFFVAEQPRGLNTPTGVASPSAPKVFFCR